VGTSSIPVPNIGIEKTEASTLITLPAKVKYQTTSSLVLRETPTTAGKAILTIPKGGIVIASQKQDNWYKVSYTYKVNGVNTTKTGWVSGTYLKEYYKYTSTINLYLFTNKIAKLYPTPDTKKQVVYSIPVNNGFTSTQTVVNSLSQTWYRVSYLGKNYYINSGDVTKKSFTTFAQTKYKANKDTYVYQSFGTLYTKLVKIPVGTIVTSAKNVGSYYNVTFGGKTGYINIADFDKYTNVKYETISTTYYFTTKETNLYTTPDDTKPAAYSIGVNNGFASTQKATDQNGKVWYRVSYNGQQLYVKGEDVFANKLANIAETEYKATKDTVLYQSYGYDFKHLTTIPKDAVIKTSQKIGNWWYKVTYNGQTGYVNIANFTKDVIKYETINTTYYFTTRDSKLYTTPDDSKPESYTIGVNNGFASTQKATNASGKVYYRVSYNGQQYYIKGEDVFANSLSTFASTNYKAVKDTAVYESYGFGFKKLTTIPKDAVITSSKKIGNWWYAVTYNGVTGYVNIADFTKMADVTFETVPNKTYINTTQLNLRQSYDANSALLIEIPVSKILVVTQKTSNGWYKTSYNGRTGYVSGSYIKEVITGDPLTSRDSYQFIDLRTKSEVTASQIDNYIANNYKRFGAKSVLVGQGQNFIDAGNQYGVNALYLAAHAIHESAFGTSNISLGKNNLFGFGSYDATAYIASYKFPSVKENIFYIAREMKHSYLNDQKKADGSYVDFRYKGAYLGFSTKYVGGTRIDAASEGMNFYYASDPLW
jgi:beta-N-acetylglucosaminidase